MARVQVDSEAPDFELADADGEVFRLSSERGEHHVVLVFNRGFV